MLSIALALLLLATRVALGARVSRGGYSLSFRGYKPMAGIRNGLIDWGDPGWENLVGGGDFTIGTWVKRVGPYANNIFVLQGNEAKPLINFGQLTRLHFNKWEANVPINGTDWVHLMIVKDGFDVAVYRNSAVVETAKKGPLPLGASAATFYLGSLINTPLPDFHPIALPEVGMEINSFLGSIDDFTLWSTALSPSEVVNVMNGQIDKNRSDLVLYYNFDHIDVKQSQECGEMGTIIQNYGISGSGYDLVLGQLSKSDKSGQHWSFQNSMDTPFRFNTPRPSVDTPLHTNKTHPILLIAPKETVRIPLPFESWMIAKTPFVGLLFRGSDNTTLVIGDDISAENEIYFSAIETGNELSSDLQSLEFQLVNKTIYKMDIWVENGPTITPMAASPGLVENNVLVHELASNVPIYNIPLHAYITSDGLAHDVGIQVLEVPVHTTVKIWKEHEYHTLHENTAILWANGMWLRVVPSPLSPHIEYVRVRLSVAASGNRSISSMVQGVEFSLRFITHKLAEQPRARTIPPPVIQEDNINGISMILESDGNESEGFYPVSYITKLPQHGRLYIEHNGEKTLVEDSFDWYSRTAVIGQYVHSIRNVSSFRNRQDYRFPDSYARIMCAEGHPMNIIGSPVTHKTNCGETKQNCGRDAIQYTVEPTIASTDGYLLLQDLPIGYTAGVDISSYPLLGSGSSPFYVRGVVVDMKGNGTSRRPVFKLDQLYVYDNISKAEQPCVIKTIVLPIELDEMEGFVYPQNCSVDHNHDIYITVQDVHSISYCADQVWIPQDQGLIGNVTRVGGTQAELYGKKYNFRHNQVEGYNNVKAIKYTEFIEVEFETPLYPEAVEIGMPNGGGAIVRILALSPKGQWVVLYENEPQKAKASSLNKKRQYFHFEELICRANFRVNVLRVELDTSTETGIPGYSSVSFVRLIGTEILQSSIIPLGDYQVYYVPNKDFAGIDSFEYALSDCVGRRSRSGPAVTVQIHVQGQPDEPELHTVADQTAYCQSEDEITEIDFDFRVRDVDGDTVYLSLFSVPRFGGIFLNDKLLTENSTIATVNRSGGDWTSFSVRWACACGEIEKFSDVSSFTIRATDATGLFTKVNATVKLFKQNRHRGRTSVYVAYAFFWTNFVLAFGLAFWVIESRQNPIVNVAQPEFLLLVLLGVAFSSGTILIFTQDDGSDGSSLDMAIFACQLAPWLYTSGFVIVYASIYAKLYRVYQLFTPKRFSPVTTSRRRSLSIVAFMWMVDASICLAWALTYPISYERVPTVFDPEHPENVLESVGFCTTDSMVFAYMSATYHLLLLSYVGYYCYKTLGIHSSFSEAKYLRVSILCSIQLILFFIPVLYGLTKKWNTELVTFMITGFIWANDFSVLCFVFFPKLHMIARGIEKEGGDETGFNVISRAYHNSQERTTKGPSSEVGVSILEGSNIFNKNSGKPSTVIAEIPESQLEQMTMPSYSSFDSAFSGNPAFLNASSRDSSLSLASHASRKSVAPIDF